MEPVRAQTKEGGGGGEDEQIGPNIQAGTPTHVAKDALYTHTHRRLLKKKGGPKYSCCSSR